MPLSYRRLADRPPVRALRARGRAFALAEARFSAVERLAGIARQEAVDAVLVAGDVFDAQTVSDRTIRRLFNAMGAYAGPWVLIPATTTRRWPRAWVARPPPGAVAPNVHLALGAQVMAFPERGFVVLPAPLTQRQTPADETAWFDHAETAPGLVRVGLAHGSVQGVLAEDIDSPNPIAADRASRAALDYLALGDWHGTRRIDARTWYSGTPEQDRFKANDPGNVLLRDIPAVGAEPEVEVRAVGRHPWIALEEKLAVASISRARSPAWRPCPSSPWST